MNNIVVIKLDAMKITTEIGIPFKISFHTSYIDAPVSVVK